MRILPEMGYADYCIKSKPLVIEDATLKLQGIEVISGLSQVEPADIVDAVNKVVGLRLKVSDDAQGLGEARQAQQQQAMMGQTHTVDAAGNITPINPVPGDPSANGAKSPGAPNANGGQPGKLTPPKPKSVLGGGGKGMTTKPASGGGMAAQKSDGGAITGLELAHGMLLSLRKRDFAALSKSMSLFEMLDDAGKQSVMRSSAELQFIDPSLDPEGLAEIASCTLATMAGLHNHTH